ncbi:MAG TPA: 30S ribosomal protein S4, partial [Spirochaetia bacterium]|nr:30S ribosomal protein S4 [Spirochaetia bacterium]
MARNSTAKGKLVRRFGVNIFGNEKYDRLLKRKSKAPGEPKKGRTRQTEYGRQLVEKQKLKFAYGLSERQFSNLFYNAKKRKGVTGLNMLVMLECRLDNVVYRLGMASSRSQARQLVSHGHIQLNGRKVTIPSALVRPNDTVMAKERKGTKDLVRRLIADNGSRPIPPWLTVSKDELTGTIIALPTREMIPTVADEQQVV